MPNPATPTRPRRRWFRFSLRSLLVFTVLVGSVMGWVAKERMQSHREIDIAGKLAEQGWGVQIAGPFDIPEFRNHDVDQGWWRRMATQLLGARIDALYADNLQISDLVSLTKLSRLDYLDIRQSEITDLSPLLGLTSLTCVNLSGTRVRDLAPLKKLANLRALFANGTQLSDLTLLAESKKLGYVDIRNTGISKMQIDALQKALPKCRIEYD